MSFSYESFFIFLFFLSLAACVQAENTTNKITFSKKEIQLKQGEKFNHEFDGAHVLRLDDSPNPLMQFSNNLDKNLTTFITRMLKINNSLEKIEINGSNIDLLFVLDKNRDFYEYIQGDSNAWVFTHYMYHDIYNALFSFSEIDSIRVFIDNRLIQKDIQGYAYPNIEGNITHLPLSGDLLLLMPNGKMKRRWYKKRINYWTIIDDSVWDIKPNGNGDIRLTEEQMDFFIQSHHYQ